MKLEKAIKNTEAYVKGEYRGLTTELIESFQLGIEALYRCQEFRKYTTPGVYMPLPGETKED